MSSDGIPLGPDDFLAWVSSGLLVNYINVAALSWYAYDYLLTLSTEVEAIWKSKPNITIILFLLNRYAFMFSWVLLAVSDVLVTNATVCAILVTVGGVTNLLNVISVAGIFILRTYAICGRNKWILGSLGLLFLARCGLLIWSITDDARQNDIVLVPGVDDVGNCDFLGSFTPSAVQIVLTVVFDAMVFILTFSRTWIICRRAKAAGVEAGLSQLLLRDGSLYFGILSAATILEAITTFDINVPAFLFSITTLFSPLEVILANRLVLNLRVYSESNDSSNLTTKTDIFFQQVYGGSRIGGRFQSGIDSVLGNIGAPLRVGDDIEYEEDDKFPSKGKEHSTEGGVNPPSREGARSEAVGEGEASDFRSEP